MKKVIVMGGSGMLGSMLVDYLSRDSEISVAATVRSEELSARLFEQIPEVNWRLFDAGELDRKVISAVIEDSSWIINAIGLTKPYTHDDNPEQVERAIRINSLFPFELAEAAADTGGRVIQIATDCVYSGTKGHYTEEDPHDPTDVYGKTKSLGEAALPNMHSLRTSIIGPEPRANVFLLEWFRRQPDEARVNGFTNHHWNGVTTLHFAKVCHGIISNGLELPQVHHLAPGGTVTKAQLLESFAISFGRNDITINPTEAEIVVDRTLSCRDLSLNLKLWQAAGYSKPPSIQKMVLELAEFDFRVNGI